MSIETADRVLNVRRARSHTTLAMILDQLGHYIPEDLFSHAVRRLEAHLTETGAEIVNDYVRAECGLPSRGPAGWTEQELWALETRRLEELTRPISMTIPANLLAMR